MNVAIVGVVVAVVVVDMLLMLLFLRDRDRDRDANRQRSMLTEMVMVLVLGVLYHSPSTIGLFSRYSRYEGPKDCYCISIPKNPKFMKYA